MSHFKQNPKGIVTASGAWQEGNKKWVFQIIGFTLSTFLINFIIKSSNFIENWVIQLGLSMFLSLWVAFILGLLNYKKLEVLLKENLP